MISVCDNYKAGLEINDDTLLRDLTKIAEPAISNISLDDNPNLLIFPPDFNEYGDKIGKEHIFEIKDNKLYTGNIMGFIGYHNTKIMIHSRFAQPDGKDYFLHYMLQKVFAINLFDLKYNAEEESIFDFLIYLFPAFLKRAIKQGVYKEYQTRHYNDSNVKGRIEVSRHIRQNIPFAGKIAYSTREYAYDNHVNQLIRHTIEYIASHIYSGNILQNDESVRDAVSLIKETTPTYNQNDRHRIISQNLRPLSHPYFSEYRNLQRLCVQILRHDELKYGRNEDEIYGILFDGAWLWEEYLNTFLKDLNFIHPQNKMNKGGKYMFSPRKVLMQPDFYIESQIVLDAKYKGHEALTESNQREDRFQLLAYMYIFDVAKSGLIVPKGIGEENYSKADLNGKGGNMYLLGLPVNKPFDSYIDYCNQMAELESNLSNTILRIMREPIST